MKHHDVDSKFESFLLCHGAVLDSSSGAEYRDVARAYFLSYLPEDLEEEMYLAMMVFSRFLIRRLVNLETLYDARGDHRSFQYLRSKQHRRYTKARRILESLIRQRGAEVPSFVGLAPERPKEPLPCATNA
ncbi:MAG: hypothetical protein JNK87_42935 [Bryobacterales bacterium]|nr:hypothetical protein [Bryobacterales bacterium]